MPPILLILLIYLLLHLVILAFRPVRRVWRESFEACRELVDGSMVEDVLRFEYSNPPTIKYLKNT
ncbi:MAG: hypothetical protein J6T13_02045 [Bacteroidales bacterium]|nr:hypothetical protein [Bacteroidales bacterium]